MRAIFTVLIPKKDSLHYLSNEEFLSLIRQQGWDDNALANLSEEEKTKVYHERAADLWDLMPEVAQEEKDFLVFYSRLNNNNQIRFIVTRQNDLFAKFRLLHPALDKLQESTEGIINCLIHQSNDSTRTPALSIDKQYVEILEKNETHKIIEGRVVIDAMKEAKSKNGKNFKIAVVSGIAFIVLLVLLGMLNQANMDHDNLLFSTIERLNTVAITSFIVSAFDFWQTYKNIKSKMTIAWTVSTGSGKD